MHELLFFLQEKLATLGRDIDVGQYVGGGIVAFDLHSHMLKWQKQLDQSTDRTAFRAHIYSSPTLVDLEADGSLEVLVGTSMVSCFLASKHVHHS